MATTTPNYGWDVPTSTDYVKDGASAIETLGDDIDATLFSITSGKNVGLVQIASSSIGSGVSSIPIDSIFSSSFDEYLIYFSNFAANNIDALQFQMRDGSGNVGGTSYNYTGIERINDDVFTSRRAANTSSVRVGTTTTTGGSYISLRISSPFLTRNTGIYATAAAPDSATYGIIFNEMAGSVLTSASYTGVNFFKAGGGTFTGGNVRIYGLKN